MSIQTQINRITQTVSTQADLMAQLKSVLETKAAGIIPVFQQKTVSPATVEQIVTPDSGYDGLRSVIVTAMQTAEQAQPKITVSSDGMVTASSTQAEGYVSAGTRQSTHRLSTQAAKTITPSTSSQTAVAKGRYTTGAVTVAAIPSTYVKPSATKAATTYTPGTSNQTIAAGTYCSGAQTIKGDANLKAANIAEGVTIFGVTGTHKSSEDLESVISQQETLIAELSAAVDGKASAGGGVNIETCSVTIVFGGGAPRNVWISGTQFIDGEITALSIIDEDASSTSGVTNPYVVNHIVKNTALTITGDGAYMLDSVTCTDCELLYRAASIGSFSCKITELMAAIHVVNAY